MFSSSSWISINSAPTWVSEISVSRMNLPSWLQRHSMETIWRLLLWTTWHTLHGCVYHVVWLWNYRKGWHVQPGPINFLTNCWRCSGIYRMRRHVSLVPCIPIPFSWSKVIDRMVLLNSNNGGWQLPKWRTTVSSGVDVTSYCLDHFKISLRAWLIILWRSSIFEVV